MNIVDRRFGRLLVLDKTDQKDKYGRCYLYRCRCDCGREKLTTSTMLKRGQVQSCGCLQAEARIDDITGRRVGRLVAVASTGRLESGSMVWRWRCDCGNEIEARLKNISKDGRVSCGCAAEEQKQRQAVAAQEGCGRIDGTAVNQIKKMTRASNNTSGRRGVCYHSRIKKWQARIMFKGVTYHLGYYKRKRDASTARQRAESMLYEPFVQWYEAHNKVKFVRSRVS